MILRVIFIAVFLFSSYKFFSMVLGSIKKEDVKKIFIYGMLAFVTGITISVDMISSIIADIIKNVH